MTVANWECGVLLGVVVAVDGDGGEGEKGGGEEGQEVRKEEVAGRRNAQNEKAGQEEGKTDVISLEAVKKALLERWGMQLPFEVPAGEYASGEAPWTQEGGW